MTKDGMPNAHSHFPDMWDGRENIRRVVLNRDMENLMMEIPTFYET